MTWWIVGTVVWMVLVIARFVTASAENVFERIITVWVTGAALGGLWFGWWVFS